MTLFQIYELAAYIAGKFLTGGALPPARVNLLFPQAQDEYYLGLLNEVIAASLRPELLDKVLATTPLRPFKKSEVLTVSSSGIAAFPSDYNRYITIARRVEQSTGTDAALIQKVRILDVLSEDEFSRRQGSIFTRALAEPFCKITKDGLQAVPYDISSLLLEYFRPPLVPYMDWCQSTANPNRIIYMPVGSSVYLDDALVPNLYDSNDVLIEAAVTKSGTYPIVSTTVEYEWEAIYHEKFVYFILAKVGVNLAEGKVKEFAIEMAQQQ